MGIQEVDKLRKVLKKEGFKVKTHPHMWEVAHKGSDVRIQVQRDERYQDFIKNAKRCKIVGYEMMVASESDILMGKVWAYLDIRRDKLKRDKDLLDIKRLLKKFPNFIGLIPNELKVQMR